MVGDRLSASLAGDSLGSLISVVKNPLSPVEHPGGLGVNCELFELGVEQFVVGFFEYPGIYQLLTIPSRLPPSRTKQCFETHQFCSSGFLQQSLLVGNATLAQSAASWSFSALGPRDS